MQLSELISRLDRIWAMYNSLSVLAAHWTDTLTDLDGDRELKDLTQQELGMILAGLESMISMNQSLTAHLQNTRQTVIDLLNGFDPGPDPDPGNGGGAPGDPLGLHGTALPERSFHADGEPRNRTYTHTLLGQILEGPGPTEEGIQGGTSGVVMLKGISALSGYTIYNGGRDGLKFGYNGEQPAYVAVENVHIHSLGYTPGAHGDGAQDDGGLEHLVMRNSFIDMPVLNDGSRTNSALFFKSKNGDIGLIEVYDSILYAGNYTIYIERGDPEDNYKLADMRLTRTAFIIDDVTPRYGLIQNEGGVLTATDCAVYFHNKQTGELEFLTTDVLTFDVENWRATNLDQNGNRI